MNIGRYQCQIWFKINEYLLLGLKMQNANEFIYMLLTDLQILVELELWMFSIDLFIFKHKIWRLKIEDFGKVLPTNLQTLIQLELSWSLEAQGLKILGPHLGKIFNLQSSNPPFKNFWIHLKFFKVAAPKNMRFIC